MRALLDVNVLIAWLDREHEHHEIARRWLEDNVEHGWASCAATQNGCLRIMCQPAYAHTLKAGLVAELLQEAIDASDHEFWPDMSLLTPGVIEWRQVQGHNQIADLYLLALAAKNGGRFVTFDKRIANNAVLTASDDAYCVIPTP